MKKILLTFGLITILVLSLVGCGAQPESQPAKDQNQPQAKEESYTVTHAMGTATIPSNPEKVVILTNEGTEALLAMGVKPVGAVKSWLGDPWYDHIKDQMEGVQVVGIESDINLEAIAALQPDLIIGNKMRQEEHYEALNAIAPTVFSETLRGDWMVNFELYAKALNKETEGQKVMDDFNKRIDSIRENLGDKINTEISIVRFMASDIRIYYKDTFAGVILDQIGLKRPESQNKDEFAAKGVTKERIPEMEGDILFYFTYEPGEGDATKVEADWINDPLWNNLEVVKSGNAHKVSDAVWNTAGGVVAANKMLDELESIMLK